MGFFRFLLKVLFGGPRPMPPRTSDSAGAPAPSGMPYRSDRPASVATPPKRPATKLNLDPGQFAPISGADARRRAAGLKWNWASVNFDRRDQIPSAAEPRTALIDGAMVAQGLLTPEQLVQIHEVGAKMAELRPDLVGAHAVASNAVAADAAERLARKQQKRAEAEERRRKHAE